MSETTDNQVLLKPDRNFNLPIVCVGILGIGMVWTIIEMNKTEGWDMTWATCPDNCALLVGMNFFLMFLVAWLYLSIFRHMRIRITEQGIVYPTIRGPKLFLWEDFTVEPRIFRSGLIELSTTSGEKVQFNSWNYDEDKLFEILQEKFPKYTWETKG